MPTLDGFGRVSRSGTSLLLRVEAGRCHILRHDQVLGVDVVHRAIGIAHPHLARVRPNRRAPPASLAVPGTCTLQPTGQRFSLARAMGPPVSRTSHRARRPVRRRGAEQPTRRLLRRPRRGLARARARRQGRRHHPRRSSPAARPGEAQRRRLGLRRRCRCRRRRRRRRHRRRLRRHRRTSAPPPPPLPPYRRAPLRPGRSRPARTQLRRWCRGRRAGGVRGRRAAARAARRGGARCGVHVSCAMFASRHASSQAAHAAGLADRAVLTSRRGP